MWVSEIPELVGRLLVQVLHPRLFDLASKKVFHDAYAVCEINMQEVLTLFVAFGDAMRSESSAEFS
jgi:hypothetical protein